MTGTLEHSARQSEPSAGSRALPAGLRSLAVLHRETYPDADLDVLRRAFDLAERRHRRQRRRCGDRYILHPLAVAAILAEAGMDTATVAAALVHDFIDDEHRWAELSAGVGAEAAGLVAALTKLNELRPGRTPAESIRRMIKAAGDPRALVIKLADRLHNMRTIHLFPPEQQERKAAHTVDVLAPLAGRLGLGAIKRELEDLAFATLHPARYDEIVELVARHAPARDGFLRTVLRELTAVLERSAIEVAFEARPKHYYSIHQKMTLGRREFHEIQDLAGVRILVPETVDCYVALGAVHGHWQPLPGRFKDYIAQPRFGIYHGLHTSVIGPEHRILEVQIRTHEMHRRARFGIHAQLSDDEHPAGDIMALTPKGDAIVLPPGSTPVDFAYSVHTELGHGCTAALVNGQPVPLDSRLRTGDIVEIISDTAGNDGPPSDWLTFVATRSARRKIRRRLARNRKANAVEEGHKAIARELRRIGAPEDRYTAREVIRRLAHKLGYPHDRALYEAVGEGHRSTTHVVRGLLALVDGPDQATARYESITPATPRPRLQPEDRGIVAEGHQGKWVKLAICCAPLPGDDIKGYVTRGGGISIHVARCSHWIEQQLNFRQVDVKWEATTPTAEFHAVFAVEAFDRQRLLADLMKTLEDIGVRIRQATILKVRERVAYCHFTVELTVERLRAAFTGLRRLDGVYDVYRSR